MSVSIYRGRFLFWNVTVIAHVIRSNQSMLLLIQGIINYAVSWGVICVDYSWVNYGYVQGRILGCRSPRIAYWLKCSNACPSTKRLLLNHKKVLHDIHLQCKQRDPILSIDNKNDSALSCAQFSTLAEGMYSSTQITFTLRLLLFPLEI